LESKNPVVATIIFVKHPFADKVKERKDVKIFEVTKKNRGELVEALLKELEGEK
jgi:nucleoside-triphosphatase THEP1